MSVQFVSGKPGGGKSLYSTMLIIDELRLSRREIVTNVALRVPELCHYLHEKYGSTFDAHQRITLLDEKDVFQFWLHRGRGVYVPGRRTISFEEGEKKGQSVTVPDFVSVAEALGCVLYVIDEVHIFFGARQWATNGKDGFYYLSQHRKFGDDVICVTQHIGNVDKQFRSVAQDYTYLRNYYKERVGMFGSLSSFGRKTYSEPYTGGGGQLCMESKRFKIDVEGICSCYDTAAGAGIVGRTGADTKERRKGIPLKYGIALALALIIGIPYFMVRGASALPHMFFKTFKTAGQVAAAQTKNVQRPLAIENRPTPVLAVSNKSVSQPETNEVFMSGFCRLPTGRYFVTLTDGREYQTGDNQVEWITENRCRINGINYERARWVHEKENSTNNAGIEVANGTPYAGGAGSIPSAVKPRIQELR